MLKEIGVSDIGHWSDKYHNWWEKNIYEHNILRIPVPSFTFSARSLESNGIFRIADGILVICKGTEYRLPKTRFNFLVPYNYGNGKNYRCPVSQFNYNTNPLQKSLF